jgi:uncharacterized protein (DUF58 family)
VTRVGVGAAIIGVGLALIGWLARWPPVFVVGVGLIVLVAGATGHVVRRPRLELRREIEPPRVEKGRAAIAVIRATNRSRRTLAALPIEQRVGSISVNAVLPRLRGGESGLRTYRLPTTRRGVFDIGPIEVARADPFGLCRTVQRLGGSQRIAVHPRLIELNPLKTGVSRNLDGPSSDTSPQGSITFHRLRPYVVGDDLRSVHWPTTARLGRLVVRHNVDTAQPDSVVLLDLRPSVYSEETFESAIDVAASLVMSLSSNLAPVQLRTTTDERMGGRSQRDPVAVVDRLTRIEPDQSGSLLAQLLLLRRDRGGTAMVVVTGRLDLESLPAISACRRRFDRVIAISLVSRPTPIPSDPGVIVLSAADADGAARAWNSQVAR